MPILERSSLVLAAVLALHGCGDQPRRIVEDTGQTFDQIIAAYANLYDREMVGAGGEKGMRVMPAKGLQFPVGTYTLENQSEDLAAECHAAVNQIKQYPLREYPQMEAVNKTEASISLPTTLAKGLGVIANAGGGSASRYQVKFETPTALVLPLSEVNKLWSKPGCSSKVFRKNAAVMVQRGVVLARMSAIVASEKAISPNLQVLNQDVFSMHSTGGNNWEVTDRAAKRYMRLVSIYKFGDVMPKAFGDETIVTRGEEDLPNFSRPADGQQLVGDTGRYGGE